MLRKFFNSKVFDTILILCWLFLIVWFSIMAGQLIISSYKKIKHEDTKEEQLYIQKNQFIEEEPPVKRHTCREPYYIPEDSLKYLPMYWEFTLEEFQLYKHIYEVYFLHRKIKDLEVNKMGILPKETLDVIHRYAENKKENRDIVKYLKDLLPTLSKETLKLMHAFLEGYEERRYDCIGEYGANSDYREFNYLLNLIDDLAGSRVYEKIHTGEYVRFIRGGGGYSVLEFKADTGELLELTIKAGETITTGEDCCNYGEKVKVYLLPSIDPDYTVGKEEKLVTEHAATSAEKDGL